MKKFNKKIISLLLATTMIFSVFAISASAADNYNVGDIIEFGSYPQSEVNDSTLLSKLNAKSLKWVSYGYYSGDGNGLGTSAPNDEMKYADVEYNGQKYRAVRFETYRASYTTMPTNEMSIQDDNGYYIDTTYWFKFEPIEWRVLDPDEGLMMCESIVDSQAFVNTPFWRDNDGDGYFSASEIYGDSACMYKHYDYPNSSLNDWLNLTFYNTAFTSTEKSKIQEYKYEYPDFSMGAAPDFIYDEALSEKIFLLSTEEVFNSDYGFDSTPKEGVGDEARIAYVTDYAKCQGIVNESEKGFWFLRSSYETSTGNAGVFTVAVDGSIESGAPAQSTGVGIRPAIKLSLEEENIYNLGEETYSFENYGDSDSKYGHCFGMSVTSSGYYTGKLDVSEIGIDSSNELYDLGLTKKVREPICYYQAIQGSRRNKAIVAGGKPFRTPYYDINSDWNEVVNYVKDHYHDNKGMLQVIDYVKTGSGHAMNFLYYKNVSGQDRIYAYDNNFPDVETYFYKDSSGKIRQAPKATFYSVDSIGLMDVGKYLDSVDDFDFTHVIYAYEGEISVEGVKGYPMLGTEGKKTRYMYEIEESAKQINIIPLIDNAEFTYLDEEYNFSAVNDSTVGTLDLVMLGGEDIAPKFTIEDEGEENAIIDIKNPSTTTISYGDSIILHAAASNIPKGGYVEWTASNGNFDLNTSSDGMTCKISPKSSGATEITATVHDANGKAVSSDTQQMTSKAGFFDKIIAFFKGLFGLTKTIPQTFKYFK